MMTKLQRLSARIASLQVQFENEKARLREAGPGRYGDATVYRIKRTKVKAFIRAAHVAVRINR